MSTTAPITEIELCGASTLRFYKGFIYVSAALLTCLSGLVVTSGLRTSSEQMAAPLVIGASMLLGAAFLLYRASSLTQVIASPTGLRTGDVQIPWSEVKGLVVRSQAHTTIQYSGGSIATLYMLPWPPSVANHLDQVVAWWREQAEVKTLWRPLRQSFRAVDQSEVSNAV